MITFSKLEKKGNLGNQLFQIASTIGISSLNLQEFGFPEWSYKNYFKKELPLVEKYDFIPFEEMQFHFVPIQIPSGNYDLDGWFQSEKYFDINKTNEYFEFKEDIVDKIKEKYSLLFHKQTILISIRRGDFVDHPDYFQLPINFYINALVDNFEDWEKYNIMVISDDLNYCKFHFEFLKNSYFAENLSAIEQLVLASLCDNFIISNSTFSWWCAWLGEKKGSKIICPNYCFTSKKNQVSNDKDFYPSRWTKYNHSGKKINIGYSQFYLNSSNKVYYEYYENYFTSNNSSLFLKEKVFGSSFQFENLIIINEYFIPPFCVYFSIQNQENNLFYLKGKSFGISNFWDLGVLKRQWDFGVFSRIFRFKGVMVKDKILFLKINHLENVQLKDLLKSDFNNGTFKVFSTHAGKLKSISEINYYFTVKKRELLIYIKKSVKQVLKMKKT